MLQRLVTTTLVMVLLATAAYAERVELIEGAADVRTVVDDATVGRTVVTYQIGAYDKEAVDINGQTYFEISTGFESRLLVEGVPHVPHVCRSIVIPDDAHMAVNIIAADYVDYEHTPVAPSKGNLPRTIDPALVDYTFGPVYSEHEWYPAELASLREPYIMRDYRGLVIELNPFQYDPGTQTLRVYKTVTLEVVTDGPGTVNVKQGADRSKVQTDFNTMYSEHFLNYTASTDKYTLVEETGSMLVICYDSFMATMQPFVDWKNQKGIPTVMVGKTTAGSTASAIQSYIQDYYDSTDVAFVLLVGDAAQIPTLSSGGGGADPMFACVDGGDTYPDLFVGRFSAENTTHVNTQVDRTITYERDYPGSDWFHKGTGIASNQGPGHNGGEYDNVHIGKIRDSLMMIGTYSEVDQIYDPSGTAAQVTAALNQGRSIINYCGHGSTTAWSSTGFSNTNVDALVNDNMLPFIFSVACVNGNFVSYTCFAEAWTRAQHGSEPTGAIGTYMSSINQDWDPPMDAEDECDRLLVRNVATSYGSLCFNGSCKMMDLNAGSDGYNMFYTWHIFGDPSVQVRTDTPAPLTVNHDGAVFFNLTEYEVEVVGVEGALCALSKDGYLYGSAYTGAGGIATIPISELLPVGEEITLTVTGYNTETVIEPVMVSTDLTIIHTPLEDTKEIVYDYEVLATVYSDTALYLDSVLVWYDAGSGWTSATMIQTRIGDDFIGYIPAQAPGTEIDYYIWAKNVGGYTDQTDTYSFRVIDYGMFMTPDYATATAPVDDTIWYSLAVTNDGVLDDSYSLAVANNAWATAIFDAAGTTPISTTDLLAADETLDFSVRVIVPTSYEDEYDLALVTATSLGNASYSDQSSLRSVSAGQPWPIPFTEYFLTSTLDMTKWELGDGITIETTGIGEPTEPYSADFDGNPDGGDELQTEQINLRGESSVLVKYWYEQTGGGDSPETGDDLIVEYLDSLGAWHELDRQLGDDPDMDTFEEVQVYLPGDAFHSAFRLRFLNTGTNGNYDDWFVDDIFVGHPSDYELLLSPFSQTQTGPAGGTISYLVQILNRGFLDDQYDLSTAGNNWDVTFWDVTGTTEITSTGLVASGDSLQFMVQVAVPSDAEPHASDAVEIHATSQGDALASGYVMVETISGGPAIAFPFYEPFAEAELSGDRWYSNSGAEVSSAGIAPPSTPNALLLDGDADELISRLIDISGQSGAILSYYYEAGGSGDAPESGDELIFQYKNEYGEWVTISSHEGDGTAMTAFAYVNVALPLDAVHEGFQLCLLTSGGAAGTDYWFVDDIRIDYAPNISVNPTSVSANVNPNDSTSSNLVIMNAGPGGLTYNLQVVQDMRGGYSIDLPAGADMEPAKRDYPPEALIYDNAKGAAGSFHGDAVMRDMGGPDDFGYIWIDSDEGVGGGTEFDWVDVSATGTDMKGELADDSYSGPFAIGFDFPFYGATYSELYVGSNGIIGFDTTTMKSRIPTPLPTGSTPNNIIAWYWKDLNPLDSDDSANVHVYVSSGGSEFVIQFVDYPEYLANAGDVVNAEVILRDDGTIKMQYLSFGAGFDAEAGAVGLENGSGTDGLEVVYKAEYLHDNLAVTFAKPYEWLGIDQAGGTIDPGMADTIACMMTSGTLEEGDYGASIFVHSNDPDPQNNPLTVPVLMHVGSGPDWICGDINNSGIGPDIEDLVYLVSYMFQEGPEPPIMQTADANGSGDIIDVQDLVDLVAYMFQEGPEVTCGY